MTEMAAESLMAPLLKAFPCPPPGEKKARAETDAPDYVTVTEIIESLTSRIRTLSCTVKKEASEIHPLKARLEKRIHEVERHVRDLQEYDHALETACKPPLLLLESLLRGTSEKGTENVALHCLLEEMLCTVTDVRGLLSTLLRTREIACASKQKYEENLRDVHNRLAAVQQRVKELKEEIHRVSVYASQRDKEHEHLAESLQSLSELVSEKRQQLTHARNKLNTMNLEFATLSEDLTRLRSRQEKDAAEQTALHATLKQELSNVKSATTRLREEDGGLSQKHRDLEDALQRERASLSMIRCQTDSQAFCLSLLDSRVNDVEKELPTMEERLEHQKEEKKTLEQAIADSAAVLPETQKEINNLKAELEQLNTLLQALEHKIEELVLRKQDIKASTDALVHQQASCREQLDADKAAMEGVEKDVVEKSGMLARLAEEMNIAVSKGCAGLQLIYVKAADVQVDSTMSRFSTLKETLSHLREQSAALQNDVHNYDQSINNLKLWFQKESASRLELIETSERLHHMREGSRNTTSNQRDELEEVRSALAQKKSEQDQEKALLDELEEKYDRVKKALHTEHISKVSEINAPHSIVRAALEQQQVTECDAKFRAESQRLRVERATKTDALKTKVAALEEAIRKMEEEICTRREQLQQHNAPKAVQAQAPARAAGSSLTYTEKEKTSQDNEWQDSPGTDSVQCVMPPAVTPDTALRKDLLSGTEQSSAEGFKSPHLSVLREKLAILSRTSGKAPLEALLNLKRSGKNSAEPALDRSSSQVISRLQAGLRASVHEDCAQASFGKFSTRVAGPFRNLGSSSVGRPLRPPLFFESQQVCAPEVDIFGP